MTAAAGPPPTTADRRRVILLGAWVACVLLVTAPWSSATDHAHWGKVVWLPFSTGGVRWRDLLGNVLLYVPLGALAMRRRTEHEGVPIRRWRAALGWLLAGAALSVLIEFSQVWSHARFPSATDVLANATGTGLGIWLSLKSRGG